MFCNHQIQWIIISIVNKHCQRHHFYHDIQHSSYLGHKLPMSSVENKRLSFRKRNPFSILFSPLYSQQPEILIECNRIHFISYIFYVYNIFIYYFEKSTKRHTLKPEFVHWSRDISDSVWKLCNFGIHKQSIFISSLS